MSNMVTKILTITVLLVATAVYAQASKISAYYTAPYADAKTVK